MMNLIDLPSAKAPEKNGGDFVEVLSVLVHKLSQPMTSLSGSIEVALMEEVGEHHCRRVLEQSLEEFRRITGILKALRKVIEIESPDEDVQAVPWTQRVEKSLKEAAAVEEDCLPQVVSGALEEVWVKAIPQHLDMVTRGLMHQVIKAGCGKRSVRVTLSVRGKNACLSIYEEGSSSDADPGYRTGRKDFSAERLQPEDLDWWMIRRAIGHMGGSLKFIRVPTTVCGYELRLPLTPAVVAGKARLPKH